MTQLGFPCPDDLAASVLCLSFCFVCQASKMCSNVVPKLALSTGWAYCLHMGIWAQMHLGVLRQV